MNHVLDLSASGKLSYLDDHSSTSKMRKQESLFKLNSKYQSEEFAKNFLTAWSQDVSYKDDSGGIHLRDYPFKLCTLQDFTSEGKCIENLMHEIVNEVEWKRLHTDFLEFHQSPDLSSVISDYLMEFHKYLGEEIMAWMQKLTGEKLTHISASCSLYNTGDRLLIHNDCVSDRRIAYVFYLSPWDSAKVWTESMGGALEVFKEDSENYPHFPPVEKILPRNNQFVFFHVNSKAWHQVGEVLSFDYPRVTINGWFHGPGKKHPIAESASTWDEGIQNPPIDQPFRLSDWIKEEYLKKKTKVTIQNHIEEQSQISLQDFLALDKLQSILEELKSDLPHIVWERTSSACERNCESLNLKSLTTVSGITNKLVEFVQSKIFFHLLYEYTELDLSGKNAKTPKCFLEIQRWKPECYTMLVNSAAKSANEEEGGILDAILYLNDFAEAGTYIYVAQGKNVNAIEEESAMSDEEDEDVDEGPLIIQPKRGALNLVYRNADMARFGAYVSKHLRLGDEYVYIVVCSYKE
ncbi:prolyl 3-hydroxylase sudestada1-like isoform X3 [Phlebotomus argentipes]|uniref:prolyl 3-hydroxylase sudestada1-like isoform X3 n=1 Tax=Phlebotomus argentipes TaxID=94469 RepID=UPI00289303DF|nr:prolyl 3-hydroxylase sudestada1-like isoform X3 [Phlebotomus argentipes]